MLVLCWPKLALCCQMLTLCWPQLPLSCPYVEPMLAFEMLTPIAVTEKAEVGTGAAAGGAALYNLRTEGLRQGHGLWPSPGFKG